jgi:hypothetical protein
MMAGPQELQLMLECGEVYHDPGFPQLYGPQWVSLGVVLQSCPYPALVDFNTHHACTLLTLAERSLEAALAAGSGAGSSSATTTSSSRSAQGAPGAQVQCLQMAGQLCSCLCHCLSVAQCGTVAASGSKPCEAKGEFFSLWHRRHTLESM